jgi:hypothetical protein
MKNNIFYVYSHSIDGRVVYIGKGSGKRLNCAVDRSEIHVHNWRFIKARVIRGGLTEDQAHQLEAVLIKQFNMVKDAFNLVAGHHEHEAFVKFVSTGINVGEDITVKKGDEQTPENVVEAITNYLADRKFKSMLNACYGFGGLIDVADAERKYALDIEHAYLNSAPKDVVRITSDFLSWDESMKHDLIVMNPPFARDAPNRNPNFWLEFVRKAQKMLTDDGVCVALVPIHMKYMFGETLLTDVEFENAVVKARVVVFDKNTDFAGSMAVTKAYKKTLVDAGWSVTSSQEAKKAGKRSIFINSRFTIYPVKIADSTDKKFWIAMSHKDKNLMKVMAARLDAFAAETRKTKPQWSNLEVYAEAIRIMEELK